MSASYSAASSCSFGSTWFSTTVTIVDSTTADFPKIRVTHPGNMANDSGTRVIPTPKATPSPTTAELRYPIFSFAISFIPVIAMDENTLIVAPPSTQAGIVASTDANFGMIPAARIIPDAI